MNALTVTAKCQVTLRKDVLRHLDVAPGDKIILEKLSDGRIEMKADRRTAKISDLFGILKAPEGVHLTIEEMNEIIAKGWAGEF